MELCSLTAKVRVRLQGVSEPVPEEERVSVFGEFAGLLESSGWLYEFLLSRDRFSESEAAAIPFFVLPLGLGVGFEKKPKANYTTFSTPVGEAP